jgi:hypothetical protein
LTGKGSEEKSLVMVGPDFTIALDGISLNPDEKLIMYVYPAADGPELVFEANKDMTIPQVNFALQDDPTLTSYEFAIWNINLSQGKSVQVVADTEKKRLYFGDNDENDDSYNMSMTFVTSENGGKPYSYEVQDIKLKGNTKEGQELAYLAYGEWRLNLCIRPEKSVEVPFYIANFKESESRSGEVFDQDKNREYKKVPRNGFQQDPQNQNKPPIPKPKPSSSPR